MCESSGADWLRDHQRITFPDSTYMKEEINTTWHILKVSITEDEFSEQQNFQCTAGACMSNRISVGKFGEFYISLAHIIIYVFVNRQCMGHNCV